jgi:hypothetical protein
LVDFRLVESYNNFAPNVNYWYTHLARSPLHIPCGSLITADIDIPKTDLVLPKIALCGHAKTTRGCSKYDDPGLFFSFGFFQKKIS